MKQHVPYPRPYRKEKRYIVVAIPRGMNRFLRNAGLVTAIVAGSNWYTYQWASSVSKGNEPDKPLATQASVGSSELYLADKAAIYIQDMKAFSDKVHDVAYQLGVPAEWLMAVMYAESKFDASVYNYKGSGAVGLIQFMPSTAISLNTTSAQLSRMNHLDQLDYVYLYLEQVRNRYGDYVSLPDLYLAILYPKARGKAMCHTLFVRSSKSYRQNSGLDEDRDGRITISDIDRRMARLFPTAYQIQPGSAGFTLDF